MYVDSFLIISNEMGSRFCTRIIRVYVSIQNLRFIDDGFYFSLKNGAGDLRRRVKRTGNGRRGRPVQTKNCYNVCRRT